MGGDDMEEFGAGFLDLLGSDENVGRLPLGAAERLMDQYTRMRQGRTFARGAGTEEHRAHRGGHPGTDRRHIGIDQLHRIVNTQPGRHLAAGRIQIQGDVRIGIGRSQEEQLGLDDVGHVVVDRDAEEDDTIHHQAAEDVHRSDIHLAFLDDGRVDVGVIGAAVTVKGHRGNPLPLRGEFLKFFVHGELF